jgi:hypothetical protein
VQTSLLMTPGRRGVRFTEVMTGQITVGSDEPAAGYADPAAIAVSLRAVVEIINLRAFIADSSHQARWSAAVFIPVLGGTFHGADGDFGLFRRAFGRAGLPVREMVYDAAVSLGGRAYTLQGRKYIEPGPLWRLWPATTTLEVRLWDGADSSGKPYAAGILRLSLPAFLRQLSTMRVTGDTGTLGKLWVMASFARFFMDSLVRSYVLGRRW